MNGVQKLESLCCHDFRNVKIRSSRVGDIQAVDLCVYSNVYFGVLVVYEPKL